MQVEEYLQAGQLQEALSALEKQIRSDPSDPKLRVFLFQLLSILGDWDRALTQLNVAAEMDSANLLMAQVCRTALQCEALRTAIFAGERSPMAFGQPEEWFGMLVQANQLIHQNQYKASAEMRDDAFEAATATGGTINGEAFEWIADADSRLGPTMEGIIDGKYYWIPFSCIKEIVIEPPVDLRDAVWLPAQFTWANQGQSFGLIPARYPDSEKSEDNLIRLTRKTQWTECEGNLYLGLGQKMLATSESEYPLLEIRQISLNVRTPDAAEADPEKEKDNG